MDDFLSVLDAYTLKFISYNRFMGDMVKNRTRILVTHNTSLAFYHVGYVVFSNSQGGVVANGSHEDVQSIISIKAELNMFEDQSYEESILPPNLEVNNIKRLILEEECAKGVWPTERKIEINNLTLKYAPDHDPVIKRISLNIKGGLFDLRSGLTTIPQDAILFSGTIILKLDPFNLDPFNQYEDQQL
ncbi:hypothetical protein K502DRAFT_348500 [Neoconidiobolus thromboides FSU 785]|nr:hypothetical protein K502DRAFT_348500 [Neoconidiobolus thromboides FSU 785]